MWVFYVVYVTMWLNFVFKTAPRDRTPVTIYLAVSIF